MAYEERPLVSVDYLNDSRSAVIDGLSTLVVDGSQLKVFAWYDNEWGYSCRLADLACHVARLGQALMRARSLQKLSPSAAIRGRHRGLLGLHPHRRRPAHAGGVPLSPAGLLHP